MKIFILILITVTLYANDLQIKANSFSADQKKGVSEFVGNVNVIKGQDEINASKIVVYMNSEKRPKKYVATGDVSFHIVTQDGSEYTGYSQKVVYIPLKKEYMFYKDVHIKQIGEKNEIISDEVVIKTTEGKAKAKSNTDKPVIMIFDVKENKKNKDKKGKK